MFGIRGFEMLTRYEKQIIKLIAKYNSYYQFQISTLQPENVFQTNQNRNISYIMMIIRL
jgi:hypothetical protein